MCCDGVHDVGARLDVPGVVRFVTLCAACGREVAEVARDAYVPAPRLEAVGAPPPVEPAQLPSVA
jgi:hypothetical protein